MRWIALALISGILLQVMSKPVLVARFLANRQFIASNLCINKSDPSNHCKGKCHLKKQLAGDNERQERGQSKEGKTVDFWLARPDATLKSAVLTLRSFGCHLSGPIPEKGMARDVFHPPGA